MAHDKYRTVPDRADPAILDHFQKGTPPVKKINISVEICRLLRGLVKHPHRDDAATISNPRHGPFPRSVILRDERSGESKDLPLLLTAQLFRLGLKVPTTG